LHILDEAALDVTSPVEIELQVGHGGLEIVVTQAVLDIRDGLPLVEKIHCPTVPERMNRVDVLQALRGQCPGEMLLAEAIDSVAGEFLSPLADKEAILIERFRGNPIFLDVETEQLRCPLLQVYKPEAISFAEYREGVLLRIEVVEIKRGDLGSPGAGVEEEMKEGVIPEALLHPEIDRLKHLQDLVLVEKPDQRFPVTLLGDVEDGFRQFSLIRVHEADHFGK